MEFHLKSREEVEAFIRNEVLTASEAIELLGISKARMTKLLADGKVKPIKSYHVVVYSFVLILSKRRKNLKISVRSTDRMMSKLRTFRLLFYHSKNRVAF